jgi:Asp-tRNA(Asn)/Glu-tRNA(Gln) amidotransferase A subunit family amidase
MCFSTSTLFLYFTILLLTKHAISSFDPREATISSTHQALFSGQTTCQEIVSSFLSRIEALNGYTNAVIALDPDALAVADEMDLKLKTNSASPKDRRLFCIPTLLKDNFDTASLPTTGGSLSLADSRPSVDAPVVTALKDAGAVIVGKTNLHEMALEGLTVSSFGGQTLNPYDSSRTPGGSSGGTGAAVAASLAVWGTGSDTVNSLRSPASANGLFSIRPTRGLISRRGIIPNSYTQDAPGPIGRCVEDIAVALTVMASVGRDEEDNATWDVPEDWGTDYSAYLSSGELKGLRFGLVEGFFATEENEETKPVNGAMADVVAKLTAAGAIVVPIKGDPVFNSTAVQANLDTQRYEWRENLNSYLGRPDLLGKHPRSMEELYTSKSGDFLVIPAQHQYLEYALRASTTGLEYTTTVKEGIRHLREHLGQTFNIWNLDAMIYPEQQNLVVPVRSEKQYGRNGILAALTGSPVVAVPIGYSPAAEAAAKGVPIGMEILGRPWTEGKLLGTAGRMVEVGIAVPRRTPGWAEKVVEVKEYGSVPVVRPQRGNVPAEYPLGALGALGGDL